jgi:hypothetical protein
MKQPKRLLIFWKRSILYRRWNMSKNIFVFCEQRDNEIANVSYELLGAAHELKQVNGEK